MVPGGWKARARDGRSFGRAQGMVHRRVSRGRSLRKSAPRRADRQSAQAEFVWSLRRIRFIRSVWMRSPSMDIVRRSSEVQIARIGFRPERLKSPQRLRKASQTARGFNGVNPAPVHTDGVRQAPSAKADITFSVAANSFPYTRSETFAFRRIALAIRKS